jgi:hypothetical protein
VQRGVDETHLVATDNSQQLLPRTPHHALPAFALRPDLHSRVALEELDLVLAVLLDLLEQVLTVQPHHLHRVQLHTHSPQLPLHSYTLSNNINTPHHSKHPKLPNSLSPSLTSPSPRPQSSNPYHF